MRCSGCIERPGQQPRPSRAGARQWFVHAGRRELAKLAAVRSWFETAGRRRMLRLVSSLSIWLLVAIVAQSATDAIPPPLGDLVRRALTELPPPHYWNLAGSAGLAGFGIMLIFPRFSLLVRLVQAVLEHAFNLSAMMFGILLGSLMHALRSSFSHMSYSQLAWVLMQSTAYTLFALSLTLSLGLLAELAGPDQISAQARQALGVLSWQVRMLPSLLFIASFLGWLLIQL